MIAESIMIFLNLDNDVIKNDPHQIRVILIDYSDVIIFALHDKLLFFFLMYGHNY